MNSTYYFKSKFGAFCLAWLLGAFGAHRFYLNDNSTGVAYLVATIAGALLFPPLVMVTALCAFVEGIVILFRGPLYFRRVLTVTESTA